MVLIASCLDLPTVALIGVAFGAAACAADSLGRPKPSHYVSQRYNARYYLKFFLVCSAWGMALIASVIFCFRCLPLLSA